MLFSHRKWRVTDLMICNHNWEITFFCFTIIRWSFVAYRPVQLDVNPHSDDMARTASSQQQQLEMSPSPLSALPLVHILWPRNDEFLEGQWQLWRSHQGQQNISKWMDGFWWYLCSHIYKAEEYWIQFWSLATFIIENEGKKDCLQVTEVNEFFIKFQR